jgi:hypothetical protein
VTEVLYRARYRHDTLTNTVTGRSIVVRGEFQELVERIPGTDEFTKTIDGFRYMVNEPGVGVTIRDVGRITYGDLEQTIVLWQAGEHDLTLDAAFQPTVLRCSRVADLRKRMVRGGFKAAPLDGEGPVPRAFCQ